MPNNDDDDDHSLPVVSGHLQRTIASPRVPTVPEKSEFGVLINQDLKSYGAEKAML